VIRAVSAWWGATPEIFSATGRRLASAPTAALAPAVQRRGQPQARDLLRYLSSELNRLYFQMWNVAQLALGAVVLWLMTRRNGAAARVVAGMLAVVVLMLVYLTPSIVSLGRELDFVPRTPEPPGMQRFWILHAAYTSLEMLKLAAAFLVAFWLARAEVRLKPDATYETAAERSA